MDSKEERIRGCLRIARGERKTNRSRISYLDDCKLLECDGMTHSAQDSDSDKREDQVNPLILPLETAPCQEEIVKTWFTQDVFVETKEQEMLGNKEIDFEKSRESMMDDGYSKYMFDDEGLPKWFVDKEKRHRQLIMPVTKEEIAAMRAQFKEINARPAKKVAEAKSRKKRAAQRKLENIQKKANSISNQADASDRLKSKMIEQLYKKATSKRVESEYVAAKKGVQVNVGKWEVLVDRRMKKDARRHGMRKQG